MTSSTGTVLDPGVDPVDPAALLAALASGLEATEASIIRLQAVRDAHLAVAQRLADDLAAASGVRGESADLAQRSIAAELAAVLHMSDRVVQGRMARAAELMTRFPATMQAFTDARINAAHVRLIQDAGARLGDGARPEYERAAVAACVAETPHRAKRIAERIAVRLAPRSLTDRHRAAQDTRVLWREELPDGQKALGLIHSAAVIDGIFDRLTQQARTLQAANAKAGKDTAAGLHPDPDGLGDPADVRTIDQLRADLAADTLLTGAASGHDTRAGLPSAIQARIEVTVPVFTAMAADTDVLPADLRTELGSAPSSPVNSPAGSPSTRTAPDSSPAGPSRGSACSPTRSPGRSSPSTATAPTPT